MSPTTDEPHSSHEIKCTGKFEGKECKAWVPMSVPKRITKSFFERESLCGFCSSQVNNSLKDNIGDLKKQNEEMTKELSALKERIAKLSKTGGDDGRSFVQATSEKFSWSEIVKGTKKESLEQDKGNCH